MSRRRTLIGGIALAVFLAVGGFLLANGTSHRAATKRSTSHPPITLTTRDASQLAANLTSGDLATVESSMVLPPGQLLPASTVRGLAALGPIRVDVRTFRLVDGEVATVVATTARGDHWRLTIARQADPAARAGAWKLLDTAKVTS